MPRKITKIIAIILCLCLLFQQTGLAQAVGGEINLSGMFSGFFRTAAQDKFRPVHLRYLSYDRQANTFKLLLDKGDSKRNPGRPSSKTNPEERLKSETKKLFNYFLIGLALPNETFWVNLRPDSPQNIIDKELEKTDIGRILLEADVQLKKDTANLTSPSTSEGKKYWDSLYKKAEELFGYENITIPTLTRPWIVPGEIIIREAQDNAYIYKATLNVKLEQDYLKGSAVYNFNDPRLKQLNEYASGLIRELIIPKLVKEVNTAKKYAALRQVYYSLILSQWFKQRPHSQGGKYAAFINRKNLSGLTSGTSWSKNTYFKQYQNSFNKGEYNLQEPHSTPLGQVIRTYTSGGIMFGGNGISTAIQAGLINTQRNSSPIINADFNQGVTVDPERNIIRLEGAEQLKQTKPVSLPVVADIRNIELERIRQKSITKISSPASVSGLKKIIFVAAAAFYLSNLASLAQTGGQNYSFTIPQLQDSIAKLIKKEFYDALSSAPEQIKPLLAAKNFEEIEAILESMLKEKDIELPVYTQDSIADLVSPAKTGDYDLGRLENFRDALNYLKQHHPWTFRFVMFNATQLILDYLYKKNGGYQLGNRVYYGPSVNFSSVKKTVGFLVHESVHGFLELMGMPAGGAIGESVATHIEDIMENIVGIELGDSVFVADLDGEWERKDHWGPWQDWYYGETNDSAGIELSNRIGRLQFIHRRALDLEDFIRFAGNLPLTGNPIAVRRLRGDFKKMLSSIESQPAEIKADFGVLFASYFDRLWNAETGWGYRDHPTIRSYPYRPYIRRYVSDNASYIPKEKLQHINEQLRNGGSSPLGVEGKSATPSGPSSPVTVIKSKLTSGLDLNEFQKFIMQHPDHLVGMGHFDGSNTQLATMGASNCVVPILMDYKDKECYLGHFAYVVPRISEDEKSNINNIEFYHFVDFIKRVIGEGNIEEGRYELYLFGGGTSTTQVVDLNNEIEKSKKVRDRVMEILSGINKSIKPQLIRPAEDTDALMVLDRILVDIQSGKIEYSYGFPEIASSPAANIRNAVAKAALVGAFIFVPLLISQISAQNSSLSTEQTQQDLPHYKFYQDLIKRDAFWAFLQIKKENNPGYEPLLREAVEIVSKTNPEKLEPYSDYLSSYSWWQQPDTESEDKGDAVDIKTIDEYINTAIQQGGFGKTVGERRTVNYDEITTMIIKAIESNAATEKEISNWLEKIINDRPNNAAAMVSSVPSAALDIIISAIKNNKGSLSITIRKTTLVNGKRIEPPIVLTDKREIINLLVKAGFDLSKRYGWGIASKVIKQGAADEELVKGWADILYKAAARDPELRSWGDTLIKAQQEYQQKQKNGSPQATGGSSPVNASSPADIMAAKLTDEEMALMQEGIELPYSQRYYNFGHKDEKFSHPVQETLFKFLNNELTAEEALDQLDKNLPVTPSEVKIRLGGLTRENIIQEVIFEAWFSKLDMRLGLGIDPFYWDGIMSHIMIILREQPVKLGIPAFIKQEMNYELNFMKNKNQLIVEYQKKGSDEKGKATFTIPGASTASGISSPVSEPEDELNFLEIASFEKKKELMDGLENFSSSNEQITKEKVDELIAKGKEILDFWQGDEVTCEKFRVQLNDLKEKATANQEKIKFIVSELFVYMKYTIARSISRYHAFPSFEEWRKTQQSSSPVRINNFINLDVEKFDNFIKAIENIKGKPLNEYEASRLNSFKETLSDFASLQNELKKSNLGYPQVCYQATRGASKILNKHGFRHTMVSNVNPELKVAVPLANFIKLNLAGIECVLDLTNEQYSGEDSGIIVVPTQVINDTGKTGYAYKYVAPYKWPSMFEAKVDMSGKIRECIIRSFQASPRDIITVINPYNVEWAMPNKDRDILSSYIELEPPTKYDDLTSSFLSAMVVETKMGETSSLIKIGDVQDKEDQSALFYGYKSFKISGNSNLVIDFSKNLAKIKSNGQESDWFPARLIISSPISSQNIPLEQILPGLNFNTKQTESEVAGIDFRAMPVVTQPVPPVLKPVIQGQLPVRAAPQIKLSEEWRRIQNMVNSGIIPSGERLKEYVQACCTNNEADRNIDKVLSCIAQILRLEEDRVQATDPQLRELIALLESGRPVKEIRLAVANISFAAKEPILLKE